MLIATISGCATAPPFPVKNLWEADWENNTCGQYEIVDPVKKKYVHVKDWPLGMCNGVFGFSTRDLPQVFDWADEMENHYKNKCGN